MPAVVICGGGVIGAAVAYFLSRHSIDSVVIESRNVASGASGTAAGLLSPPSPADRDGPPGQLAARSLDLHFELARTLDGVSHYAFEPLDMALVARDEREATALRGTFGAEAWLGPDALREACPWVEGQTAGGVLRTGGAQLDPGRLTSTLLEAAGADVVMARVTGVDCTGARVTAVQTDSGLIETERVVLAMGPWSAEAGGWLGLPVPVAPLKGQILRMDVPDAPSGGFSDADGNYLVRKPNGVVYTGTTEEDAGFDEAPTPAAKEEILAYASRIAHRVRAGRIIEQTACLRPLSADGLPIIGSVPGVEGAFVATGHGRKGIMHSLATGEALAELIATGHSTTVDLEPFAPSRFSPSRSER